MQDRSGNGFVHVPVMAAEVVRFLDPRPGGRYLDATLGEGGHAAAILLASSPDGFLVGLDRDPAAIASARRRLEPFLGRFEIVRADFSRMPEDVGRGPFDGVVLDLGLSSLQLGDPARGFSFMRPGPLDMRMDPGQGLTAAEIVNRAPRMELERIFREFGQERFAGRIARAIVEERSRKPLKDTAGLADIVTRAVPGRGRIHPATRVFQALRIAVNGEMERLDKALADLPGILRNGGRAVVVSFHSLEDGRVKRAFRAGASEGVWTVLTPKPVVPSREEMLANPRARSAKLRAAEKRQED